MDTFVGQILSKLPYFFGAPIVNCAADQKSLAFFGLPKWYRYLPYSYSDITGKCEIHTTTAGITSVNEYWLIGIAVLQMLLQIAGIIAVVFVIYGGFTYLTSTGEPDKTAEARKTILNALIGAVIAIMAASIVGFIGSTMRG